MVSKARLRKLIDEVSTEYEKCWKILAGMKDIQASDISGEEILEFQPTLASALFRLDVMYHALSGERTKIIERKKSLSPQWSNARLRKIAAYQKSINNVIELGKSLGDSFAWAFYRNDRLSLERHFQHPKNSHAPPGVGGQGEVEFIRNIRVFEGKMILYHGITTFLRIGDVSLIDLKTQKVIALGELKSKRVSPDQIEIGLFLTGPNLDKEIPIIPSDDSSTSSSTGLPTEMEKNLWKQFDRMEEPFKVPKADRKAEYYDDTQIEVLQELSKLLERKSGGYKRAGDGLLFVGIKNPKRKTLSSRFLMSSESVERYKANLGERFPDLVQQTLKIIDEAQAHTPTNANSLFIGQLSPVVMPGTIPLFWRDIPLPFLRSIFFYDSTIIILYNPAHLIRRLREIGYDVELVNNGRHHKVSKIIGDSKIEIMGMDYFESLVTHYLTHEDVIVALFEDILRQIAAGAFSPNSRITLRIKQGQQKSV